MASSGSKDDGGRWSLKGMTALVTGGTRGIGYAVVEELAGFGATVHTCSRNEAELNKYLEEWNSKGFQVTGSVCDVSSRAEREREKLIETVSSTFNAKLNILVNNVGRNIRKPPMTTNFDSVYHLCLTCLPSFESFWNGKHIVFISSVAGVVAINSGTIYAANKVADDKGFVDKIIAQTPLRRVGDPKEVSSLLTRFLLHYWAGYFC